MDPYPAPSLRSGPVINPPGKRRVRVPATPVAESLPADLTPAADGNLVVLCAGAEAALFLVPGAAGPVPGEFARIAPLCGGHAVYAFPTAVWTGAIRGVERLAASCLEDVRRVRPKGPYRFAGFSSGGLVALEMARALRAAGERVDLLAMVDCFPPIACWGWQSRVRTWKHWRDLREAPEPVPPSSQLPAPGTDTLSLRSDLAAAQGYRPAVYDGQVTFLRANDMAALPDNPGREWRQFVRSVAVVDLTGARPRTALDRLRLAGRALSKELLPYPHVDLTMV